MLPSSSDFTPDAFFGHANHSVGRLAVSRTDNKCACSSGEDLAKQIKMSASFSGRAVSFTPDGHGFNVSAKPFGEPTSATLKPGFTPSFATVGLPHAL